MKLLRWGQSAYETDSNLKREKDQLETLGCSIVQQQKIEPSSDIQGLLVTSKVQVSAERIETLPNLEFILTTTSGYEHIDLVAAHNRGIKVGRCPMARKDAVVETSLAMGLTLMRNLPALHHQAQKNHWARSTLPSYRMPRIKDVSIGLIGYGLIGKAAARVWSDLGAKVRWHDPKFLGSLPLEELCAMSDIISLHCSHTPSSHQLINTHSLQKMKPGTIIINTARGKCIDIEALMAADHLGGYGLDVFPQEPPPNLSQFAAHPNTILLPHAAGYHDLLGDSIVQEVYDSVALWLEEQRLLHPVEP